MKKFLIKIFVFSIPGILWLIPPAVVLKASGENYTGIENAIQHNKKYLIGYAYNEENYKYLKWTEVNLKPRQKVLALGSSRILQFRKGMFDSSFYNAGYTISGISDFIPFLESIPENKYPEVLIITLDQWMFNGNWDPVTQAPPVSTWKNSFNKYASFSTLKTVWSDLLKKRYGLTDILKNRESTNVKRIGLNAVVNDKGFRTDGSISYGDQVTKLINKDSTADDYNYKNTLKRIDNGNMRFEYGSQINPKALHELERFLKFCGKNKIQVIAIIPPFANTVNEHLKKNGNHLYLDKIYALSKPMFTKYGFELWDMSDLSKYGSGDGETIDGFHGGEVCYLKMLIHMIENDSKIKEYSSVDMLKTDLAKRMNDYVVYEY